MTGEVTTLDRDALIGELSVSVQAMRMARIDSGSMSIVAATSLIEKLPLDDSEEAAFFKHMISGGLESQAQLIVPDAPARHTRAISTTGAFRTKESTNPEVKKLDYLLCLNEPNDLVANLRSFIKNLTMSTQPLEIYRQTYLN